MTPSILDDLDIPRTSPAPGGDRRTSSLSLPMVVGLSGLVLTLVSLVFTAGYNWRGVAENAATQKEFMESVSRDYVRKDVAAQQMITLETKLDEIAKRLGDLQRGAK